MSKKIRKWKIEFELWDYSPKLGLSFYVKKEITLILKAKLKVSTGIWKIKNLKLRRIANDLRMRDRDGIYRD